MFFHPQFDGSSGIRGDKPRGSLPQMPLGPATRRKAPIGQLFATRKNSF
jgi:hypothetical protein